MSAPALDIMQKPPRLVAVVIAVVGLLTAGASMYSVVPRIRLVEAISLFATAFAAGAAVAVAVANMRDTSR